MGYRVPFVDLPAHYTRSRSELLDLMDDVLFTRADLIMRDDLRVFEENMACFVGVKYAVGVGSGTDALRLALLASGLGPGDEVVTVAHTFVATLASIVHCGGSPVLVDVGEDFNMDVEQLEQAISPRAKAILPVHLNGRVCDMETIAAIARRHNLVVIEDAAQAMGGKFDGKRAGSFGLAGCFSLFPMKILGGIGDGGIVVTNDGMLADRVRMLRDHGQERSTGEVHFYGFNSRLDNLNAAILNLKLKHLPEWIDRRRRLASIYNEGLSDIPQVKLPPPPESDGRHFDVYQNYVIRAQQRDELVGHLNKCGIEVLISWRRPLHRQKQLRLGDFHLPQTDRIAQEVVSLPLNTEIADEQVHYVIESVHDFYAR